MCSLKNFSNGVKFILKPPKSNQISIKYASAMIRSVELGYELLFESDIPPFQVFTYGSPSPPNAPPHCGRGVAPCGGYVDPPGVLCVCGAQRAGGGGRGLRPGLPPPVQRGGVQPHRSVWKTGTVVGVGLGKGQIPGRCVRCASQRAWSRLLFETAREWSVPTHPPGGGGCENPSPKTPPNPQTPFSIILTFSSKPWGSR